MTYRTEVLIRFCHCDPAGIVFYPRYVEIFHNIMEDWCRDVLHLPLSELMSVRHWGLPAVHLNLDFIAPSFLGEILAASLNVARLGKTSITLNIGLQDRVRCQLVIVLVDLESRTPIVIPDDLREILSQ